MVASDEFWVFLAYFSGVNSLASFQGGYIPLKHHHPLKKKRWTTTIILKGSVPTSVAFVTSFWLLMVNGGHGSLPSTGLKLSCAIIPYVWRQGSDRECMVLMLIMNHHIWWTYKWILMFHQAGYPPSLAICNRQCIKMSYWWKHSAWCLRKGSSTLAKVLCPWNSQPFSRSTT